MQPEEGGVHDGLRAVPADGATHQGGGRRESGESAGQRRLLRRQLEKGQRRPEC